MREGQRAEYDFAEPQRMDKRLFLRLLGGPYTLLYVKRSVESRILFSLLTVEVSLLLYHVLLSLEQSRNHLPLCRNLQVFVEGIGARLLISFHPLLDLNL